MLKPVKYSVGKDEFHIFIEYRGENSWAVTHMGECLDHDGNWEYEPSPSNRDSTFIKNYRFASPEEAFAVLKEKSKLIINGKLISFT